MNKNRIRGIYILFLIVFGILRLLIVVGSVRYYIDISRENAVNASKQNAILVVYKV